MSASSTPKSAQPRAELAGVWHPQPPVTPGSGDAVAVPDALVAAPALAVLETVPPALAVDSPPAVAVDPPAAPAAPPAAPAAPAPPAPLAVVDEAVVDGPVDAEEAAPPDVADAVVDDAGEHSGMSTQHPVMQ